VKLEPGAAWHAGKQPEVETLGTDAQSLSADYLYNDAELAISQLTSHIDMTSHINLDVPMTSELQVDSDIPCSEAYAGPCGFSVSLESRNNKPSKSEPWTYDEKQNKLFVRMCQQCPFRVLTTLPPPPGAIIRATPVYMEPMHVREAVLRCPNHATSDSHPARQHIVRCHHPKSVYDLTSYRPNVTVPYYPPQVGSQWNLINYSFVCFSSCVGGLNRRPIQVIFTLEQDDRILGRHTVEVRVCACPGRDREVEARAAANYYHRQKRRAAGFNSPRRRGPWNNPVRKRETQPDAEVFTLKVWGRHNYDLLCNIRDALELKSSMHPDDVADLIPS